ncbi:MAG TPA: hypothetical protein VMJ34_02620 [Bryobacteraceae bacterium]|nr:hypothetical protein [Bryobacteraceae bacterium]
MEAEAQKLWQQCVAIRNAHEQAVAEQRQAIFADQRAFREQASTDVHVYALANSGGSATLAKAERPQYPGAKAALRSGNKTVVCFGGCQLVSDKYGSTIKTLFAAGSAPKVQALIVEVEGTPHEADTVLAGLTGNLAQLIGK